MTKFYRKEHLSSLNMSRVNCFLCGGGLTDQEHLTQHHLIGRQDASDLVSNLSKLLEDEICEVAEFVDKLLSSHSDSWRLEEEDASLCKLEAEADDAEDKYIKGEVAEDEEDNEDKEEITPAKRAKHDPDYEEDPGYKEEDSEAEFVGEREQKPRRRKKGTVMMGKLDKLALQEPVLGESLCPGNDCGKVFNVTDRETEKLYRRHVFYHKWKKILRLQGCCCKFNIENSDSDVSVKLHMYREHRGRYHCKTCFKSFWSEGDLREHQVTEPHVKDPFVCFDCGYTSDSKTKFSYHRVYHHSNETFVCHICSKTFNNSTRYKQHLKRDHSEKKPCTVCGEMIKNMPRHMKTMHTEDRLKKHPCDECGKGFGEITALKSHQMSVHIKARPFPCRFGCGASSNIAGNRNKHEINKHGRKFAPDKERWPKKDIL